MTISIISSMTQNYGMGLNNQLLISDPFDMAYFREVTIGNIIIMGRLTYESIGSPLPNRTNIVITSNPIDGVPCFPTLLAALQFCTHYPNLNVFIIGGPRLFTEALDNDWIDSIHLTTFYEDMPADTFFPYEYLLDPKWLPSTVVLRDRLKITKFINLRS